MSLLTCPSCGRSLHDQFAASIVAAPPRIVAPRVQLNPIQTLEAVRSKTCYDTLRTLIGGAVLMAQVACILAAAFFIVPAIAEASNFSAVLIAKEWGFYYPGSAHLFLIELSEDAILHLADLDERGVAVNRAPHVPKPDLN